MNKVLLILSSLLLLTSCAEQYNIAGNSNIPCLDGRMLYLRVSSSDDGRIRTIQQTVSVCLDSCKVVHGKFNFEGDVDSTMMAMIYTGNQCVMPLVLENGRLSIQVDNATQSVTGGPLNDRLYKFFKKRSRLDNEMWELQRQTMQLMRDGYSPAEVQQRVGKKLSQLNKRTEDLESKFVMDNYDNVLGPGFFRMLCSQYPTPIMTQQISRIVNSAPSRFLNDPFVNAYVRQARARMMMQQASMASQNKAGYE
ncbi:MAG: DUF4369 domain-containing protein [Prevotellamassilia sp.]|uniref:DUF4369 domain-containing protein n=1 Tax=Alloprevotella sp. TaxID=1872471 RepID=UPI0015A80D43|nr:DUF4369 domain-containing protein [Prevotellamassilia sp.]